MFFRRLARLLDPRNFFLPEESAVTPEAPLVTKEAPLKLSDAILKGIPLVEETRRSYHGCAIGTAYMYKTRRSLCLAAERGEAHMVVAREFGIPKDVVARASYMHFAGAPRLGVALWLRTQGF